MNHEKYVVLIEGNNTGTPETHIGTPSRTAVAWLGQLRRINAPCWSLQVYRRWYSSSSRAGRLFGPAGTHRSSGPMKQSRHPAAPPSAPSVSKAGIIALARAMVMGDGAQIVSLVAARALYDSNFCSRSPEHSERNHGQDFSFLVLLTVAPLEKKTNYYTTPGCVVEISNTRSVGSC